MPSHSVTHTEAQLDVQGKANAAYPQSGLQCTESNNARRRMNLSNDPLGDAFYDQEFRGNAPNALIEYLSFNNGLFMRPESGATPYHGRFGYLLQGKGVGKSRCSMEIGRRGVFVIYMNLRHSYSDLDLPVGDPIPRQILVDNFGVYEEDYGMSCCAFFAAVFKVFGMELMNIMESVNNVHLSAVQLWHVRMCGRDTHHRSRFFDCIRKEYEQFMTSISPETFGDSYRGALELRATCNWLIKTFPSIFNETDTPKVAIVIDEAQRLRHDGTVPAYSRSEVLCRVIADYSRNAMQASLWVLFVSSDPAVAMFGHTLSSLPHDQPATKKYHTQKPGRRERQLLRRHVGLFLPFTALGWDHCALPLGSVKPKDVAQLDHVARFGRPWWHMLTYFQKSLEGYLLSAQSTIWPTMDSPISLILPRYCLRFDVGRLGAQAFLQKTITSLFAIYGTRHGHSPVWMQAAYPSEPFFANLCASQLHQDEDVLGEALRGLYHGLDRGYILTEPDHRLESRLLLLSCKDIVAERLPRLPTSDARLTELTHCRMVPVTSFLETMFGPHYWPSDQGSSHRARITFADAYVNFSHWIMSDTEIGKSRALDPISGWSMKEWLLRLWTRTAAIQCSGGQPDIDQIIPIYFDIPDEDYTASGVHDIRSLGTSDDRHADHGRGSACMSYLLIRSRTGSSHRASFPTTSHCHCETLGMPYITIILDLRSDSDMVSSTLIRDQLSQCLQIRAFGASEATFKFLTSDLAYYVNRLLARHRSSAADDDIARGLRNRYTYSGTAVR